MEHAKNDEEGAEGITDGQVVGYHLFGSPVQRPPTPADEADEKPAIIVVLADESTLGQVLALWTNPDSHSGSRRRRTPPKYCGSETVVSVACTKALQGWEQCRHDSRTRGDAKPCFARNFISLWRMKYRPYSPSWVSRPHGRRNS